MTTSPPSSPPQRSRGWRVVRAILLVVLGLLALLVLVNSFYHGALPSVAVNAFWIAIAVFALSRVWLARRPAAPRD